MIFRLFRRLDLMRMCLGIFLVIDGYPLIFFFKEFLRLAPGSTIFTAIFLVGGFVLMIPLTLFRRLYRPNMSLFWLSIAFLVLSMLYMFFYNINSIEITNDLIYYAFIFIFLFLLINTPNDIVNEMMFVGVVFAVVSNLALIYALVHDPTWTIGQRAAIQYGADDARTGNPHVFARNAQIGMLCALIWGYQRGGGSARRGIGLALAFFNLIVLMLTFSKSAILSTFIVGALYVSANANPTSIREFRRQLFRPASLLVFLIPVIALQVFIYRNPQVWGIIQGYGVAIFDRFSENISALVGGGSTSGYRAELDDSSRNRVVSFGFVQVAVLDHVEQLILGFGYKFTYLDVPILEALINGGIIAFILLCTIVLRLLYDSIRVIYGGGNEMEVFLSYLYVMTFILFFTNGRPYDMSFWHPLCLSLRFLGIYYPEFIPTSKKTAQPVLLPSLEPQVD